MKKILIIPLLLLLITGCTSKNEDNNCDTNYQEINDNFIYYYTDEDTCVEYIVFSGYRKGGITPKLNTDGTIKLNKKCLERNK